MDSKQRAISLPEQLCASAEQRFGARFKTLESLLEFVLSELTQDEAGALDRTEQEILEKRLRDLGYL